MPEIKLEHITKRWGKFYGVDDHAIMEVTIPPEWMDRTIGEINIRKKYNINILALKKDGKLDMNITPDTQLCRDESILVLGKYALIQKCFRL